MDLVSGVLYRSAFSPSRPVQRKEALMRPNLFIQSCLGIATLVLISVTALNPGCHEVAAVQDAANRLIQMERTGSGADTGPGAAATTLVLPRTSSGIVIGSMNIQTFGVSKIANPEVMSVLVQVARQFDCLAIQEIRSKHDQTILKQYVAMINANGARYDYVLSPLLGNSSQTFQYGFIYDTARIELTSAGAVVPDPLNLMHREPMFSRFRTRAANPAQAFTFTLVNVHIDPDRTQDELAVLSQICQWLAAIMPDEDDLLVLGDFNEPPSRYGSLWQNPRLRAAIGEGVATNTLRNAAYDNVLFDGEATLEYAGYSGVLDLQAAFGLTLDQAQAVSDHSPVWAAFSATEAPRPQYARQPALSSR
jgi:endonuclease/exonuclease/phosphatase family metal-dependent hydrolase